MEFKRKLAMVVTTLAVALGVGHVMQNGLGAQPGRVASNETPTPESLANAPQEIVPLAAGLGGMPEQTGMVAEPGLPALPEAAFTPAPAEQPAPEPAAPAEAALPAPDMPEAALDAAPALGPVMGPASETVPAPDVAEKDDSPEAALPEIAISGDSTNCPVSLDVMASALATLDLTLQAPCRASERVVIRHGGLTVTGMTSLTGTLFTSIPGMDATGAVSVLFGDGLEVNAAGALPDLALYRRFAVQWMADDTFQINAFENGAQFGEAGHVSATNPHRRIASLPMQGGYLSLLGDGAAPLPMLAEVYTFPQAPDETVVLTIEASVTEATCNRELLGEVLLSEAGTVTKTDLTMATPTCDAIGDVLVLNNPLPDLKLAAAN